MKKSVSHSCATQGEPARVKEKESACGTVLVCAISWPVSRCHHTSGSLTLRADRATIPRKTTTRKVCFVVSHPCARAWFMRPPSKRGTVVARNQDSDEAVHRIQSRRTVPPEQIQSSSSSSLSGLPARKPEVRRRLIRIFVVGMLCLH